MINSFHIFKWISLAISTFAILEEMASEQQNSSQLHFKLFYIPYLGMSNAKQVCKTKHAMMMQIYLGLLYCLQEIVQIRTKADTIKVPSLPQTFEHVRMQFRLKQCKVVSINAHYYPGYLLQMCIFVLIFFLHKRSDYSNRINHGYQVVPSLFKQNLIETNFRGIL